MSEESFLKDMQQKMNLIFSNEATRNWKPRDAKIYEEYLNTRNCSLPEPIQVCSNDK